MNVTELFKKKSPSQFLLEIINPKRNDFNDLVLRELFEPVQKETLLNHSPELERFSSEINAMQSDSVSFFDFFDKFDQIEGLNHEFFYCFYIQKFLKKYSENELFEYLKFLEQKNFLDSEIPDLAKLYLAKGLSVVDEKSIYSLQTVLDILSEPTKEQFILSEDITFNFLNTDTENIDEVPIPAKEGILFFPKLDDPSIKYFVICFSYDEINSTFSYVYLNIIQVGNDYCFSPIEPVYIIPTRNDCISFGEYYKYSNKSRDDESARIFRNMFVNTFLYIHKRETRKINYIVQTPDQKLGKKKARELEVYKRETKNVSLVDLPVNDETFIRYDRNTSDSLNSKAAHIVRGHWRNQAYGKDRKDRKYIFIAPYFKGNGELPKTEKVYRIK